MSITISNYPSWIKNYWANPLTISGTPTVNDVGTYTLKVTATDTNNQSTSTTFQINVIQNYSPVV